MSYLPNLLLRCVKSGKLTTWSSVFPIEEGKENLRCKRVKLGETKSNFENWESKSQIGGDRLRKLIQVSHLFDFNWQWNEIQAFAQHFYFFKIELVHKELQDFDLIWYPTTLFSLMILDNCSEKHRELVLIRGANQFLIVWHFWNGIGWNQQPA